MGDDLQRMNVFWEGEKEEKNQLTHGLSDYVDRSSDAAGYTDEQILSELRSYVPIIQRDGNAELAEKLVNWLSARPAKLIAEFRRLSTLNIKDNFVFISVLRKKEICERLLQAILGVSSIGLQNVKVERIKAEHALQAVKEGRGIRFDVYVKTADGRICDVEMQVARKEGLPRRARYYVSQVDSAFLPKGVEYAALPELYVIFICDFLPFKDNKHSVAVYRTYSAEEPIVPLDEGVTKIFLSTKGEDRAFLSKDLRDFLDYVECGTVGGELVELIEAEVAEVTRGPEGRFDFMVSNLWLHDAKEEGKIEGKIESLLELYTDGLLSEEEVLLKLKDIVAVQPELLPLISNCPAIYSQLQEA